MAVPSHVDRGTVLATAGQELSTVVARSVDEFVGVTEIDRLDIQRARRWQDDQVGAHRARTACEIGVLLATPPSISQRSPSEIGASTAGIAALALRGTQP